MKRKGGVFNNTIFGSNGRFKTASPRKAMEHADVKGVLGQAWRSYLAAEVAPKIAPYSIPEVRGLPQPSPCAEGNRVTMEVSVGHPFVNHEADRPAYATWMEKARGAISVQAFLEELQDGGKRAYLVIEGYRKGQKGQSHYVGRTDGAVESETLREYVNAALRFIKTGHAAGAHTYTVAHSTGTHRDRGPVSVRPHSRSLPGRRHYRG